MGNGEDIQAGRDMAGTEANTAAPGDAWLERRLRVFERALNALEERQERVERTHTMSLGLLEERVGLGEARLEQVEIRFGESHRALEIAIEEATQRLHAPLPEPVEEVTQEILAEKPAEEIVYVEVEPVEIPVKVDFEFLAAARRSAIEAATKTGKGKRKSWSLTKPLLICIAALTITLMGAALFLRHTPGTANVAAASVTGSGTTARRVAVESAKRLEVLADAGNRRAMHILALQFAERKDMAGAARWFARAAALGYGDAQFNLAVLYERGEGVRQSLVEAYVWYTIAAEGDDLEAAERVEALLTQLKPAQLAVAERAIRAFRPEALDATANNASLQASRS